MSNQNVVSLFQGKKKNGILRMKFVKNIKMMFLNMINILKSKLRKDLISMTEIIQ